MPASRFGALSLVLAGVLAACVPEPRFPVTAPRSCQAELLDPPSSPLCRTGTSCIVEETEGATRRIVGLPPPVCPGDPTCPSQGGIMVGGGSVLPPYLVPSALLTADGTELLFLGRPVGSVALTPELHRVALNGGAATAIARDLLSVTSGPGGRWIHAPGQLIPSNQALARLAVDLPSLPRNDRLLAHAFAVDDQGRVLVPLSGGLFVVRPVAQGDVVVERVGTATPTDAVWHGDELVSATCVPATSTALIRDEAGAEAREVRCQLSRGPFAATPRAFASLNGVQALVDGEHGVFAATGAAVFFVGFDGRLELLYRVPDRPKPQQLGAGVENVLGATLPVIDVRREAGRLVIVHGSCETHLDRALGHSFIRATTPLRLRVGPATFTIMRGR